MLDDKQQQQQPPRLEVVVVEAKQVVTDYSDHTRRVDQKLPDAPAPAPISVDTTWHYSLEELQRLHNASWVRVQAGGEITERQPVGTERRVVVRAPGYESGFDNN